MPAFSSVTNLLGALRVNYALPAAAQEDVGGKLAAAISAINQLTVQMSYIQTVISASQASGVTFSGLSGTAFSGTPAIITNFASA